MQMMQRISAGQPCRALPPAHAPPMRLAAHHIMHASSSDMPSASSTTSGTSAYIPATGNASSNGVYPDSHTKPSIMQRIKEYFVGSKLEKEKLASLGMGAFASYGVISNLTYGTCLTIAWLSFVKATGMTPLMEGQWKPFLAFYLGLWTMQNFVRPMRFALAVALAPAFDRIIGGIGDKTGLPKPAAFVILLACISLTTVTCLFSALYLLGGFPGGVPFFK